MGYDHTMHLKAKVRSGTTVEQVADAFKPIMEYMGYDGIKAFTKGEPMGGTGTSFSSTPKLANCTSRPMEKSDTT
ncbi:hypothetical protein [Burkholderia multivorans]|uniref:hypothetical protein n=1 Tax=Burkholderia multivorans TaxID=87883 RepID=UPI001C2200F3|nr:hypothetical protein [Burkholderia multivorans]MBU9211663.1 hypothetical protein [Burkholderia multivorans]